jgi:hypothetical protein
VILDKTYGVYDLRDKATGFVHYVGVSRSPDARFRVHCNPRSGRFHFLAATIEMIVTHQTCLKEDAERYEWERICELRAKGQATHNRQKNFISLPAFTPEPETEPIPATHLPSIISRAMSLLGSRKTPRKAEASKLNGRLGGRPKSQPACASLKNP